ncbi:MAG TPA: hypothetical protein VJ691_11820 [Vicinamibacterales bacterium]|nr:hypothetical protein [Vicinamibacterales bacterium]
MTPRLRSGQVHSLYERFVPRNQRALARVFFGRLFENDFFSSSTAATSNLMFLIALVAVPGVMFSGTQTFTWAHLRGIARRTGDPMIIERALIGYQAFHIAFAMAVAFVVTMMVWSSLTPDRKDALVLGPLPVSTREQALGRLLALMKFFGLFAAAVTVPTAVAFNFVSGGPETVTALPQLVIGHIAAAGLGIAFVFFTLLNAQLLLAALFGPRVVRLMTLPLQVASLGAVIAALASSQDFGRLLLRDVPAGFLWHPLAWFVGLYRWIGGDDAAIFGTLAARGAVAGIGVIGLAVTVYPLAYERCLRNVITMDGRITGVMSRRWSAVVNALLRPLLRTPLQRSLASFMLATLTRSHTHRFLIGIYFGVALLIALPIADRLVQPPDTNTLRYAWFAVPLGFMFWLICGVRVALMMPIEPVANWIFQLTEPVDKRRMLTTVVTVMASVTCVPIAAITAATLLALGYTTMAGTVFLIVILAGLVQIEALTITMKTVPFTCTYLPGQLRLRLFWPFYFYLWLTVVFRLTEWCLWALGDAQRTLQLAGFLFVLWVALRVWHLLRARKINTFTYDEQPPPLVTTMDIATQLKQI